MKTQKEKIIKSTNEVQQRDGYIDVRTLTMRLHSEIEYLQSETCSKASESVKSGYIAGLYWVIDYLKMMLAMEKNNE